MAKHDGGSAFPVQEGLNVNAELGMTLRDYFAISMAPEFWREACTTRDRGERDSEPTFDEISSDAYRFAGEMLKARDQ